MLADRHSLERKIAVDFDHQKKFGAWEPLATHSQNKLLTCCSMPSTRSALLLEERFLPALRALFLGLAPEEELFLQAPGRSSAL